MIHLKTNMVQPGSIHNSHSSNFTRRKEKDKAKINVYLLVKFKMLNTLHASFPLIPTTGLLLAIGYEEIEDVRSKSLAQFTELISDRGGV